MWNSELEEYHDPDGYLDREDELMKSIGFLAAISGRLPHEIFEDPDWPDTVVWDLRCSNFFWKELLTVLKTGLN